MSDEEIDEDLLVAMYVTGGESIVNSAQKADRESFEPKEKKHKGITRYFAVPEEQICNNCGEAGHLIRNCTKPYVSDAECFYCNQVGHIQSNCPLKMDTLSTNFVVEEQCRTCFRVGHLEDRCPDRRKSNAARDKVDSVVSSITRKRQYNFCPNCASTSHVFSQCRVPRYDSDYAAAQKNTPSTGRKDKKAGGGECFECGETGHQKKDCPSKRSRKRSRSRSPERRYDKRDRDSDRRNDNREREYQSQGKTWRLNKQRSNSGGNSGRTVIELD